MSTTWRCSCGWLHIDDHRTDRCGGCGWHAEDDDAPAKPPAPPGSAPVALRGQADDPNVLQHGWDTE